MQFTTVRSLAAGAILSTLLPVVLSAQLVDATPGYTAAECPSCAEWNAPHAPVRVFGNVYYVGTNGLSAILLTSPQGHVLIDGGLPESAAPIAASIRALGFRVEDVKLILNSHAHYDHAGGIAALQRMSHGRVAASGPSALVLEHGTPGIDDPQYGIALAYPVVAHVERLRDGDTVRVGAIALVAHLTPGHTSGGTTWSWRSCDAGRCLDFVYADSQTPVSAEGFSFSHNTTYPAVLADFARGFATLEGLRCDVLLTPHPSASRFWERLSARDAGGSPALIDGDACRRYATSARALLAKRLESERRAAPRDGYVVTADSARLYYRIAGTRGDTIIAIHGGPGVDLESIAGDFAPLAERHVVIFYDQRGTGRSSLPRDTITLNAAQQVRDLDDVRRHFGLARVTLVAHSYGPLLAATYAIAHPDIVKRMVFFGPVPPRRGDFWKRFGQQMAKLMDSAAVMRLNDAGRRLNDSTADARAACRDYWAVAMRPRLAEPERTLPLIRSDLCASDPAGIRFGLTTTNRVVMASYGAWDLRTALSTVPAPTLVVHGENEAIPMDLVQEWTTALPHATLLRVPRAAHFTYAERPEIVWPAVERFLAGEPPVP